jgi:hypothetical protein
MLIALLLALGVDLIVVVAFAALVGAHKRRVLGRPDAFRGAIRVTSGEVDGRDRRGVVGRGAGSATSWSGGRPRSLSGKSCCLPTVWTNNALWQGRGQASRRSSLGDPTQHGARDA